MKIPIEKNVSLFQYNTFGMSVIARSFSVLNNNAQLSVLSEQIDEKQGFLILGGGSNFLLTKDVQEWVIFNQLKGIGIVKEDEDFVWIESGAGEVWHDLVLYSIDLGLGGLENLSLIPGSVGASPVQNIGAYGIEVKDVLFSVKAWHIKEKCFHTFTKQDCQFAYRDSIFKNKLKNQYIITSVVFKLRRQAIFNTGYGGIQKELDNMKVSKLSIKAISDAVIQIRRSKLPDPAIVGNAGSFFKNPVIATRKFENLKIEFLNMPSYTVDNGSKIPAAWLIEQCGWKGYRQDNIGVHPKQSLVLVNYGGGKGKDIFALSERIIDSVAHKFNINLEKEVQIYG